MTNLNSNLKMKAIKYILTVVFCTAIGVAQAEKFKDLMDSKRDNREANYALWGPTSDHQGLGFVVRAGYVLGGTTPLSLPAEIRKISEFSPKDGFSLGVDGYKYFNMRWGLSAGLRFFMQGMHTGAEVKNYNMALVMGQDVVEGRFTGTDITETRMTGFTIPVMATYRVGARWTFDLGPYFSYWIYRDFNGEVFDGYLREGSPIGQKISISADNPASYDFSSHMRNVSWGMEFCVDYRVRHHLNVFGLLDWGMSDVFKSDFKTVTFPLFPLYATWGVAYYY
ncbi:MAG: PorT family protein [Paraprevotella sp.]|nr:PorT family protein [Paraprevotella sp.]